MSKKKRKSSKKKNRGPEPGNPPDVLGNLGLPPIDPRLMENAMRDLLGHAGVFDEDADPAMAEALELVDQAYESRDALEQLELAADAMEICPDCADAYILAAELAPTAEAACLLYHEAMNAAARAMGPEAFEEAKGHFWSVWGTRPYMRARHGLVQNLWMSGERDEAIKHCQAMLELNPNDNQGVRYLLASYYCDLGRDDDLHELLGRYEDERSAEWWFSYALLSFRKSGDSAQSREMLKAAHEANPHVAPYLLGHQQLPDDPPEYIEWGGQSEAASYAMQFLPGWRSAAGAITWMRKTLQLAPPENTEPPRRRSLRYLMEAVSELPQAVDEIWQVDLRKTSRAAGSDDSDTYSFVITNPDDDQIVALEGYPDGRPSPKHLFLDLLELIRDPADDEPRRPEVIEVRLKTLARIWKPKLEELGIACELCDELSHVDFILEHLEEAMQHRCLSSEEMSSRRDELAELPQDLDAVWQIDDRRLSVWITEDGMPDRPWASIVTNRSADFILQQNLSMEPPTPESLWQAVMTAMLEPMTMEPHLPREIQVCSEEFCEWLTPHLDPLGVACVVCDELDMVDFIFNEMERGLEEPEQMPAMIDTPGVTTVHVAGLFAAAAGFYRATPWHEVRGDLPIRIQCDHFSANTWYAVVMGQSGMTLGLALYEDLDALQSILSDEEGSERRNAGLSVMYGEPFEIAIRDLDAAERNGWPVAGPEAYPLVLRVNPGMAVRPPLAWELELGEACLRAVPAFLKRKDRSPARMAVPAADGELVLELSWLD